MSAIKIKVDAQIDVGCVRTNNEDNFIISPNLSIPTWTYDNLDVEISPKGSVLVVADGMGGLNAGEVASKIAIESIQNTFTEIDESVLGHDDAIQKFLIDAIQKADAEIVNYSKVNPETKGMGTTIVVAWLLKNTLYVAWCGDSRAYIYHPEIGLKQISCDHSYVQELVNKGSITREQAFYHPDNNIISRSLGSMDKNTLPEVVSTKLYNELRILLCSDGLNGMISDEAIYNTLSSISDIRQCSKELINQAKQAGGHDNVTVVLCDIVSGALDVEKDFVSQTQPGDNRSGKKWRMRNSLIIFLLFFLVAGTFWCGGKYYSTILQIPIIQKLIGVPSDSSKKETVVPSRKRESNYVNVNRSDDDGQRSPSSVTETTNWPPSISLNKVIQPSETELKSVKTTVNTTNDSKNHPNQNDSTKLTVIPKN